MSFEVLWLGRMQAQQVPGEPPMLDQFVREASNQGGEILQALLPALGRDVSGAPRP
jgi:hypothetical protein